MGFITEILNLTSAVDPEFIKMLEVEEDEIPDEAYDSNEDNRENPDKKKADEQQRHEENYKKYGKELRGELMRSKRWGKREDFPRFQDVPSSMARESRRIFKVKYYIILEQSNDTCSERKFGDGGSVLEGNERSKHSIIGQKNAIRIGYSNRE